MTAIWKVFRIGAGFIVLTTGLIMALPGVPGPGIAVMILGLVILAEYFHWARRLLAYFKQKAARLKQRIRK